MIQNSLYKFRDSEFKVIIKWFQFPFKIENKANRFNADPSQDAALIMAIKCHDIGSYIRKIEIPKLYDVDRCKTY